MTILKNMDYHLADQNKTEKVNPTRALRTLYQFLKGSRLAMFMAFVYLLINSATTIIAPFIIGDVTNKYLITADKDNLLKSVILLGAIYIVGAIFRFYQALVMGRVGQDILLRLRAAVFRKVQSLPLMFFNQNKSGDLISRINNDTEKMNQAFSETLLRFTGNIVIIFGIGGVMIALNPTLGAIAWAALGIMLLVTQVALSWMKAKNARNLQKLGEMSGEIQESLTNFKVTVVFNRRDYFRNAFAKVNEENRQAATGAGIANGVLAPIYNYSGTIASALILVVGIQLLIFDKVATQQMPEIGTLLTFILYSNSFFGPLRELGELFSQFQTAIASWTRIYRLLRLESNLKVIESEEVQFEDKLMAFHNVSFGYDVESMVLSKINMELDKGKTYALVGPTGGGKSTTASLMARLYDVSEGQIFYKGKDIRTYEFNELAKEIGFILQEPFLFTGTLADNIKYGNDEIADYSEAELEQKLVELGLEELIKRFNDRLQTEIKPGAENISLGQRQLIAFVRILLRQPRLLILDEATANIDTVTEKLLEDILNKLPKETTKVIIAHRLNTIENADQIFFISGGAIEKPLDFKSALGLIETSKGKS